MIRVVLLLSLTVSLTASFIKILGLERESVELNLNQSKLVEEAYSLKIKRKLLEEELENTKKSLNSLEGSILEFTQLKSFPKSGNQIKDTLKSHVIWESIPTGRPVEGDISSNFGFRIHPISGRKSFHEGVDFSVPEGTPVFATADGIVEGVRPGNIGDGNLLRIDHGFGMKSSYSHLKNFMVGHGDVISKGDLIAYSGNTGSSTAPHLHYEIWHLDNKVDPTLYLKVDFEEFTQLIKSVGLKQTLSILNTNRT
ncbi:cell wall endopeptidase [Vibrio ishigakensis]|uniref:Cell wall endopeptidase n=1 Tax=Vibrio ishigakensis TaxID=1481914 RepID=A0A0B8PRH2_9VIBR|nr:cell wall endopeptidase [Vibrio ishigakensis]